VRQWAGPSLPQMHKDLVTSETGGPSPYRAVEPWLLLLLLLLLYITVTFTRFRKLQYIFNALHLVLNYVYLCLKWSYSAKHVAYIVECNKSCYV
jgi:hypothetical protein